MKNGVTAGDGVQISPFLRAGKRPTEIAAIMECSRNTVYEVKKRLKDSDNLSALEHKAGAGRPVKKAPEEVKDIIKANPSK